MALFGSKKTPVKEVKKTKEKAVEAASSLTAGFSGSDVILRPRITEKASYLGEQNVYAFEIRKGATKGEVAKAIKDIYKIKPVKVNIVKNPAKKVFYRGKIGKISGVSKAYVYVKKGEKIEII